VLLLPLIKITANFMPITLSFQVGVRNLKVVGSEGWALVQEGEAEKQVFSMSNLFVYYNYKFLLN